MLESLDDPRSRVGWSRAGRCPGREGGDFAELRKGWTSRCGCILPVMQVGKV